MISKAMNSRLYIAPLVPPPMSHLNERYKHAFNLLNKTIKDTASELNIAYVPINLVLKQSDFIDSCCHLSEEGARKVASELHALGF